VENRGTCHAELGCYILVIAVNRGILGFCGIAGASIEIDKVIFFIAGVLFLISAWSAWRADVPGLTLKKLFRGHRELFCPMPSGRADAYRERSPMPRCGREYPVKRRGLARDHVEMNA